MARTKKRPLRFKLPTRIRSKRSTSGSFSARIKLIERIADLPGVEAVERNDEVFPRRVTVYLRRQASDRVLQRRPAQLICSLDRNGITVTGLSRWERYQVLANGWGKLIDDQVCVCLPRDLKELEIVWSIFRRAYDRLYGPANPEAGTLVISTWDWPRFSRTSLQ